MNRALCADFGDEPSCCLPSELAEAIVCECVLARSRAVCLLVASVTTAPHTRLAPGRDVLCRVWSTECARGIQLFST